MTQSLHLQLMKATGWPKTPYISSPLQAISTTVISTDVSQVGVALFPLNLNSREKFEPGPGFEPRTSRSLAWRSTT